MQMNTVNGLDDGCRQRRNGRRLHEARMDVRIHGEKISAASMPNTALVVAEQWKWAACRKEPVRMAPWTWRAMYGNGWRTGMMQAIIANPRPRIPAGRRAANTASCGAVPGSILRGASALLTAAGTVQTTRATTSSGSVVPVANRLRKELAQHPVRAHRSWDSELLARSEGGLYF